jgi:hypothetical protein
MEQVTYLKIKDELSRYYRLVQILHKFTHFINIRFNENPLWFYYSEKIALKLLRHCKSQCLNSADTFIFSDTEGNKITLFRYTRHFYKYPITM